MFLAISMSFALSFDSQSPSATSDPYAIYQAAMKRLAELNQPEYIIDTEHWVAIATVGGQSEPSEWDERRIFNSETRRECVLNVPYVPKPPQIGPSEFAPDSWLIARRATTGATSAKMNSLRPDLSDIPTVASVVVVARPSYAIRLIGIDPLTHSGKAYHLSLRPLFNPMVHNLRELWINTETNAIMRAVIEGYYQPHYNDMPDDTYVTEDFGQVGPYWLVIHHAWTYHRPLSSETYQYDATSTGMQFPDNLPDWFFDAKQFQAHYSEVSAFVGP